MSEQFSVSVIVPFYNAESHIKKCLGSLISQDFTKPFEIIMINDASTDNSINVLKKYDDFPSLKFYSLSLNSGPGAARNFGLKKAKGEYIFFLDVDDTIATNTLTTLYAVANENTCDLVISDKKWIENSQNQRNNIFVYPKDKTFGNSDIMEAMQKRLYDPISTGGLFAMVGGLIKSSIIKDNNIFFEEKLRYLEDETFAWDVLAFVNNVRYVRKQLYSYHVNPNINTGLSDGLDRGYPVSYFKLVKNHIQNSLKQRGASSEEIQKLGDRALIYNIISALVSYSRSMILGKVKLKNGIKCRRKIIDDILADSEVSKAIRNYFPSKKESSWIPKAIAWRSRRLLEFACNRRAKTILKIRRKGTG